jgi:hypothetical protein
MSEALSTHPVDSQKARMNFAVARKAQSPTKSVREIAYLYDVPQSTLQHRLNGRQPVDKYAEACQRLTHLEELAILYGSIN